MMTLSRCAAENAKRPTISPPICGSPLSPRLEVGNVFTQLWYGCRTTNQETQVTAAGQMLKAPWDELNYKNVSQKVMLKDIYNSKFYCNFQK